MNASNLTRKDVKAERALFHKAMKRKQSYSTNLRTYFLCKTLPAQREIPPDPGCDKTNPARCPNTLNNQLPICRPTYKHCAANSGCVNPEKPFRCITGECVAHISYCVLPETNFSQNLLSNSNFASHSSCENQDFERCFDGVCRYKGTCSCLDYSGCRFNEFQCPDGTCTKSLMECAGFGNCPMNKPYMCSDLSCVSNIEICPTRTTDEAFPLKSLQFLGSDHVNFLSQRKVVLDNGNGYGGVNLIIMVNLENMYSPKFSPFYDSKSMNFEIERMHFGDKVAQDLPERLLQEIKNPAEKYFSKGGFHGQNLGKSTFKAEIENEHYKAVLQKLAADQNPKIYFKYVAKSRISKIKSRTTPAVKKILGSVYNKNFGVTIDDNISLRSVPVEIWTEGRMDNSENFNTPINGIFRVQDLVFVTKENFDDYFCLAFVDSYGEEWKCVSRASKNFTPRYNGPEDYLEKAQLNFRTVEYDIPFPGTFAVILYPQTELLGKPMHPCDHTQNPNCEPDPTSTKPRNLNKISPVIALQTKDL